MKSVLGIIVIIAFVSLGTFGFLAINHSMAGGHMGCIAASSQAVNCPNSIFSLAVFHISFLKSFSQATMPLIGLIMLYALAAMLLAAILKREVYSLVNLSFVPARSMGDTPISKQSLFSWLSLLEKRDPYIL